MRYFLWDEYSMYKTLYEVGFGINTIYMRGMNTISEVVPLGRILYLRESLWDEYLR
jgi:hypothetical protein